MQFKLFKNLMKLVDKEGWNFVKHFFFTHLRKMTFVERLITQLHVVSKQENPQQFQEWPSHSVVWHFLGCSHWNCFPASDVATVGDIWKTNQFSSCRLNTHGVWWSKCFQHDGAIYWYCSVIIVTPEGLVFTSFYFTRWRYSMASQKSTACQTRLQHMPVEQQTAYMPLETKVIQNRVVAVSLCTHESKQWSLYRHCFKDWVS